MSKERTGTLLRTRDGRWQGMVSRGDGSRMRLPPFPKGTSESEARELLAKKAKKAATTVAPKKSKPTPELKSDNAMTRWFDAWIADRVARGKGTDENTSHYVEYIKPAIGPKHIRTWTKADLRKLVRDLDAKVQRGDIAWKTAINIWATAKKMCDDAAESKLEDLRCRPDNVSAGVRGPDRGDHKGKQWLYPSEFLQFVGCEEVPLKWRRCVALAVYMYPRDSELRPLLCRDADTEHRVLRVTKKYNRRTKKIEATKGRRNRSLPIEPALVPLLEELKAEAGNDAATIAHMPSERDMARGLRRWLKRAGVTRHELHEPTPTTKPIWFHDLRATGITWMAVRGDDPLKIQQRAGHEQFSTTEKYIRAAEALEHGIGEVFPELPESLFQRGFACDSDDASDPACDLVAHGIAHSVVSINDFKHSWRGGRDSNPRPPA